MLPSAVMQKNPLSMFAPWGASMKKSGLAIVVNDSHPEILKYGDYKTDTNGGHGAVREVCDIIEALNN